MNDKSCLICWEKIINENFVKCVRCNILLHNYCEERYRSYRKYCKCPHCQRIGTLGSIPIRHKITFDKNYYQQLKYNIEYSEFHFAISPEKIFGLLRDNSEKINNLSSFTDVLNKACKPGGYAPVYSSVGYISTTLHMKLSENNIDWLERLYNLCII